MISEALNLQIFRQNMPPDPSKQTRAFSAPAKCVLAPPIQNKPRGPWLISLYENAELLSCHCKVNVKRFSLLTRL